MFRTIYSRTMADASSAPLPMEISNLIMDLHIPLPGIVHVKKFENWTKCVLAQNITRKALREPIERHSTAYLKTMPHEQILHLPTFVECTKGKKIKHFHTTKKEKRNKKSKTEKIKWKCSHEFCGKMLDNFLDEHNSAPKRNWNININSDETKPNFDSKKSDSLDEAAGKHAEDDPIDDTARGDVGLDSKASDAVDKAVGKAAEDYRIHNTARENVNVDSKASDVVDKATGRPGEDDPIDNDARGNVGVDSKASDAVDKAAGKPGEDDPIDNTERKTVGVDSKESDAVDKATGRPGEDDPIDNDARGNVGVDSKASDAVDKAAGKPGEDDPIDNTERKTVGVDSKASDAVDKATGRPGEDNPIDNDARGNVGVDSKASDAVYKATGKAGEVDPKDSVARNDVDVDSKKTDDVDKATGTSDDFNKDDIIYEYFWDVMKLYTFTDTEKDDAACEDIESLELVQMLKMIRDCKFLCDGDCLDACENVRKMRNSIMHSADNSLEETDLHKYFENMVELLSKYPKSRMCEKAIKSLKDLEKEDLFKLAWLQDALTQLIRKALKLRKNAIKFDMKMARKESDREAYKIELATICNQIHTIEAMPSQVQELSKGKETLEQEVRDLIEKLRRKDKSFEELQENIRGRDQLIQELQGKIRRRDRKIERLEERLEDRGILQAAGEGLDSFFGW